MGFDDMRYFEYLKNNASYDNDPYTAHGPHVRVAPAGATWADILDIFWNTASPRVIEIVPGRHTVRIVGGDGLRIVQGTDPGSEVLRYRRDAQVHNAKVNIPSTARWASASVSADWEADSSRYACYIVSKDARYMTAPTLLWAGDGGRLAASPQPQQDLFRLRLTDRLAENQRVVISLGGQNVTTGGYVGATCDQAPCTGGPLRFYQFTGQQRLQDNWAATVFRYRLNRCAYGWAVASAADDARAPPRLLHSRPAGGGVDWNERGTVNPSPRWLWCVVPAFADGRELYTLFAPTEPTFTESLRRLGIPERHPSRLENHYNTRTRNTDGETHWAFVIARITELGNPVYWIKSNGRYLTLNGHAVATTLVPSEQEQFFVVPRVAQPGWDLVHYKTGRRVVQLDGRVVSTELIHPPTYWDVTRAAVGLEQQRCLHFWPPLCFRDCFGVRYPEDPYPATRFRPVCLARQQRVSNYSQYIHSTDKNRATFLQDAGKLLNSLGYELTLVRHAPCAVGMCLFGDFVVQETGPDFVWLGETLEFPAIPFRQMQDERRAYQDAVARGPYATGECEWSSVNDCYWYCSEYPTYFRRDDSLLNAEGQYRHCLRTVGPESRVGERVAAQFGISSARRLALDYEFLIGEGRCRGAMWLSEACRGVCSNPQRRSDAGCQNALREHCAAQYTPRAHDTLCGCWMQHSTYEAIQEDTIARSGLQPGTPFYNVVRTILTDNNQPQCWYAPCIRSDVPRDASSCPTSSTMVCLQNISDSNFEAGRDIRTIQSCNFAADAAEREAGGARPGPGPGPDPGESGGNIKDRILDIVHDMTEEQKRQAIAVLLLVIVVVLLL